MNYKNIYEKFVDHYKSRKVAIVGITHKHHIIPTSLGGSSSKDNLVVVTVREHIFLHRLLAKFSTGRAKYLMSHAYTKVGGKVKVSREYRLVKEKEDYYGVACLTEEAIFRAYASEPMDKRSILKHIMQQLNVEKKYNNWAKRGVNHRLLVGVMVLSLLLKQRGYDRFVVRGSFMYDNVRYKPYGSINVVLKEMLRVGLVVKIKEDFHRNVYYVPETIFESCEVCKEDLEKVEKAYFKYGNKLFTSKSKKPTSGFHGSLVNFINEHSKSFDKFIVMDVKTRTVSVFTPMGNQVSRTSFDYLKNCPL